MGLDVVLAVVVLAMAVRGWLRGFWAQSIRLSGLVTAVYLAGPLADAARPWVAHRLASVDPGVLDRLLWWGSGVVAFFVVTGMATGILNLVQRRRRQDGLPPQHRGDQSAGVLLGVAKGAVISAFMLQGIGDYAREYIAQGGWFGEQVRTSRALPIVEKYQPAKRIWASEPVRRFVGVIREEGIGTLPTAADVLTPKVPQTGGTEPIRTARRPAPLQVPQATAAVVDEEERLEADLRAIAEELDRLAEPPDSSR